MHILPITSVLIIVLFSTSSGYGYGSKLKSLSKALSQDFSTKTMTAVNNRGRNRIQDYQYGDNEYEGDVGRGEEINYDEAGGGGRRRRWRRNGRVRRKNGRRRRRWRRNGRERRRKQAPGKVPKTLCLSGN